MIPVCQATKMDKLNALVGSLTADSVPVAEFLEWLKTDWAISMALKLEVKWNEQDAAMREEIE